MASGYYLADGVTDLDAVFEPASGGNGVTAPGYVRKDNGAVLQYAALSAGSAVTAATEYFNSGNADFKAIWAKKGSVSYLSPTTSFLSFVNSSVNTQTLQPLQAGGTRWNNAHVIGENHTAHGVYSTNSLMWDPTVIPTAYCNFGNTSATAVPNKGAYMQVISHSPTDTLTASLTVSIRSDGTWQVIAYGTNSDLDAPTNGAFVNPNPSQVIASGNWSGVTGAGVGAGYTYTATFSNQKNFSFYVVGPGGSAGNTAAYTWLPAGPNTEYQYVNPGWNNGYSVGPPSTNTSGATSGSLSATKNLAFNVACSAAMATAFGDGGHDYEAYGEDNWYHRLFTIDLSVTITSPDGHSLVGQIPLVIAMHWYQASYGSSSTGGGGGGGGGCVVAEAELFDGGCATDFDEQRVMLVTDPYYEDDDTTSMGRVEYSELKCVPCVAIRTAKGALLKMSHTAPIPTEDNGFMLAPDLKNQRIPIAHESQFEGYHGDAIYGGYSGDVLGPVAFEWDEVVEVEDIGDQWVQHLTVSEHRHCFWARTGGQYFILHHNLKQAPGVGEGDL